MTFINAYADGERAAAYARLAFPGTYYLAFRDLPAILAEHVAGPHALDFGCGAGRSTRFLRELGFDSIGIDISPDMIRQARVLDPHGRYLLIDDGELDPLPHGAFDLVLSAFTFDNIPGVQHRVRLLGGLRERLNRAGKLVLLGSTPEMYTHDWASFATTQFHENARARSGDVVRVIITDVDDARPVEDVFWLDHDYQAAFRRAGLDVLATYRPLASSHEPYPWVNEARVAPWVIYVLGHDIAQPDHSDRVSGPAESAR
jgi:SAM-dependent methyltransferase